MKKNISIPIYPGIIYVLMWLFHWVAYQGGEEAEVRRGHYEQPLPDRPPLI